LHCSREYYFFKKINHTFKLTAMNSLKDPVLLFLTPLLAATLLVFFLGIFPYPFGVLILLIYITARVLNKR